MDLGKILGEEGGQGVGVGVPDQQQLGGVGVLRLNDAQGLVAAQEGGVLVLLAEVAVHIEAALGGGAVKIGGHLDPVAGDVPVDGVGGHPPHAGGGEGGAVKLVGHRHLGALVQGNGLHAHGLHQGLIAVVGPQAGPVVVGAVVDVLVLVGLQGAVQVHGVGLHGVVQGVDDGLLVGGGSALGQAVGPDGGGGGDETEVDGHIHVVHQLVHVARVGLQSGLAGGLHPVEEGVLLTEVDAVVLLLAAEALAPGLQGHPEVPADDVVVDVVLGVLHKLAAVHIFQRQLGSRGQVAVFHGGELLVGEQDAAHQNPSDKQGEEDGEKNTILFAHKKTLLFRSGNTGRGCRSRPPDRRCRP